MLPDRPLVRRRTALTGALGGIAATVLAAGCDTGDDVGESDATGSPSPSSSAAQEPEQTPDEALVDDVLTQLGAAVAVLQAARRFKQLRPTVAPVLHAHRSHVEVLEGDLEGETPASRPADLSAAVEAVRLSETQLQAGSSTPPAGPRAAPWPSCSRRCRRRRASTSRRSRRRGSGAPA